jgi:hypothetical protein
MTLSAPLTTARRADSGEGVRWCSIFHHDRYHP